MYQKFQGFPILIKLEFVSHKANPYAKCILIKSDKFIFIYTK